VFSAYFFEKPFRYDHFRRNRNIVLFIHLDSILLCWSVAEIPVGFSGFSLSSVEKSFVEWVFGPNIL